MAGEGHSSMSFWWRRWTEESRVPVPVPHNLYLHVTGSGQVLLDVDRTVPEIRLTLPTRPLVRAPSLGVVSCHGEALAAAPRRGLHGHGEAVLLTEEADLFRGANGAFRARHHRDIGPGHDPPALHLAPHCFYRRRVRTYPDEPCPSDRPGERGAFGQEAISGCTAS